MYFRVEKVDQVPSGSGVHPNTFYLIKGATDNDFNIAISDNTGATVYKLNKVDLVGGVVSSAQLPSYVDDILPYPTLASFPPIGELAKIYSDNSTALTYRWDGVSQYLEMGIAGGSVSAAAVIYIPTGSLTTHTVQAAIGELDANKQDKLKLTADSIIVTDSNGNLVALTGITIAELRTLIGSTAPLQQQIISLTARLESMTSLIQW